MKRILLTAIMLLCISAAAIARQPMKIDGAFNGKYASDPNVTETVISGDNRFLTRHHLTSFMSFKGDAKTYSTILAPLVLADGQNAIGKKVSYKSGALHFAFFKLAPVKEGDKQINRYIYYVVNQRRATPTVTLIYFDGTITPSGAERLISSLAR